MSTDVPLPEPPVLRQYVQARSAKGRARQEMQLLSVIWGWARLEGMTALPWPAAGMQRSGWKGKQGLRQVEVSDAAFAALHRHADQCLRDALDIASACGLRVTDVLGLPLPQKSERRPIDIHARTCIVHPSQQSRCDPGPGQWAGETR